MGAAGLGVGSLLDGVVVAVTATYGYDLVVIFNGLSFFFAAGLVLFGVSKTQHRNSSAQMLGYSTVVRDRPFLLLIVANACFALCSNFIYLAVPIYFTTT